MRLHRRAATVAVAAIAAFALLPTLAAQAQPEQQTDYVALGDSYSSGTGTSDYFDEDCLRSELAFPQLLADELGAALTFAACSGATTADLLATQIGELDAETDLVTVTVGGNDIGWSEAIQACIAPLNNCIDDIEAAEARGQAELPGLLEAVYGEIGSRASNAEVYVLGYPRLFNAEDECDAFGQVSIAEQERMNQGADLLSGVIQGVAEAHGFAYVDVRDTFEGHAVCDDVEYIHGLRYPTVESYHPNALGHANGYFPEIVAVV